VVRRGHGDHCGERAAARAAGATPSALLSFAEMLDYQR
jgi:hypothetical protein